MTINEYQKHCTKTIPAFLTRGDETLLALMALNGVSGDCVNYYKEVLYMSREMAPEEFAKKLGEVIRCVAICAHGIDYNLSDILKMDIEAIVVKPDSGDGEEK